MEPQWEGNKRSRKRREVDRKGMRGRVEGELST